MSALARWIDASLAAAGVNRYRRGPAPDAGMRWLRTDAGSIRVLDSGGSKPCVVIVPDGPNVIEHYASLVELLKPQARIVCFDMPGFGFSVPCARYDHSLDHGAAAVLAVMDQLGIAKATLAFSCANGFYALRLAQLAPHRVHALLLSQTPSFEAMRRWARRNVPSIIHWPIVGQWIARLARRKLAAVWYRAALAPATDGMPFRQVADRALRCGACFSLAGVVQGLMREPAIARQDIERACTALWGMQDRSHRKTPVHSIQDDAPKAKLIRFNDCGHFPDLENPRRFAQILLALMPAEMTQHV